MRIGIDARMCGPQQGGLGRYIEQLIIHLLKIDSQNEYVLFLRQENWDNLQIINYKFKKVLADIHWYSWKEQLLLTKIIKKEKIDLMHFPHWNVPLFYNDPFIVTIHDLLLLHYPTREASTLGPISYWFKNKTYRAVLKHAVNKARHIITPSEFTKQDVHKTLNIPLEKITATHLAPFNHPGANKQSATPQPPLPTPYVLYVGVAFPHKNLNKLIEAWKIFQQKYDKNYHLVLAGKKNYFYNKIINNKKLMTDKIIFTGFLSDNQLAEAYSNASLYIFSSLYEGFGLPPLEAMKHNIPVISSNATCLPEILENAAFYFNPNNNEEIATAIYRGLTDKNLREQLKNNAQILLKKYSWEQTAKKTLNIYNLEY